MRRVAAELDGLCDDGAITNIDGRLVCFALNGGDLPAGTFTGSCQGCKVSNDELACAGCLDGAGASHATAIALAGCDEFGNEQGKLVCTAGDAGGSFGSATAAAAANLPHDEL
ncbi:hypothetical protein AB1Y20_009068 [Prymnesium parvum]|uniref:Subtilisin n=1 Tax=Prymnesium parvum TaxID=97485 RepID=A0AB34K398_PRYPA